MTLQLSPDAPARRRLASGSLDVLFAPESVAVFGATETSDSVGRALMTNLIRNPFGGVLFPISTSHRSVLGVRAYPALGGVPAGVDLAIVAGPAPMVPGIIEECQAAGVKAAMVLSAGLADSGPAGAEVERQVRARLRAGPPMRVLGMNSSGLACPRTGLNATFAPGMVGPGEVGFLSQSGAVLTALLDPAHSERVGCSAAVSVGSLLDISWTEWLDYLAQDPQTRCVGIYMERLDDPRAFFAAAREVAPRKPIILVKGGRGGPEDPARDEVFEEACRSSGVLRVGRIADLFRMAAYLMAHPKALGSRLSILTNARGPAVLAADSLRADGGRLASLAPETVVALSEVLPARWDRQNPIDVGEGGTSRLARAATVAARDPNTDALLVLLAPQATIDPVEVAFGLGDLARATDKPVLCCWMWGAARPETLAILRAAGIPTFHSPEAAVRTFGYLWRHSENLRFLGEIRTALVEAEEEAIDQDRAAGALTEPRQSGRERLTEVEVQELFASYGLPVQQRRTAVSADEAAQAAADLGYPVSLELVAAPEGEVVRVKAVDEPAIRRAVRALSLVAREHHGVDGPTPMALQPLIPPGAVVVSVSAVTRPDLGTVIRLGALGRIPAEPRGRVASSLAPLTPLTAREMIEHAPGLEALRFPGGAPLDLAPLERFLLRLSRLAVEQTSIREVTVGSLVTWDAGVLARDVHVVLQGAEALEDAKATG
jgi:acetyltransferase